MGRTINFIISSTKKMDQTFIRPLKLGELDNGWASQK
jgi:hypothetical protein